MSDTPWERNRNSSEEPFEATADVETTVSSNYKVLGEDAISDGAGVLGHNTSRSGTAFGVEGVTESSNGDAAAIRADAPNGGIGLQASATRNNAIDASASGFTAIDAVTDGNNYTAIDGQNTATSGWAWGVSGRTGSDSFNAFGVRGKALNNEGKAKGVGGITAGDTAGATGVYGEATNSVGAVYGVDGITQSSDAGTAGVHGEATASDGDTLGVDGVTNSSANGAAGVRGRTREDNRGVLGEAYDDASNLPALSSSRSAGVVGRSDKSNGRGVVGWSVNDNGVVALTEDEDEYTAALKADHVGDGRAIYASGNVRVNGHVDVSNVGLSVSLSENQSIPDDPGNHTIEFDVVEHIDFGSIDTSTGVYTVPVNGDYHVSVNLEWDDTFNSDKVTYRIINTAAGTTDLWSDATEEGETFRNYSKTLFGVSANDTIETQVAQNSGSSKDVRGGEKYNTSMTIHKVG